MADLKRKHSFWNRQKKWKLCKLMDGTIFFFFSSPTRFLSHFLDMSLRFMTRICCQTLSVCCLSAVKRWLSAVCPLSNAVCLMSDHYLSAVKHCLSAVCPLPVCCQTLSVVCPLSNAVCLLYVCCLAVVCLSAHFLSAICLLSNAVCPLSVRWLSAAKRFLSLPLGFFRLKLTSWSFIISLIISNWRILEILVHMDIKH